MCQPFSCVITKNVLDTILDSQKFSINKGVPSNQKLPKMRSERLPTNGTSSPVRINVPKKAAVRINTCTEFVF